MEYTALNLAAPFIYFFMILISAYLSGWRVTIAFLLTAIICPLVFSAIGSLWEIRTGNSGIDLEGFFMVLLLFALGGIPFLLIIIAPIYHLLLKLPYPIRYIFPAVFTIIGLTAITLLATKPLGIWGYLIAFTYAASGGVTFLQMLKLVHFLAPTMANSK